MALTPSNTFMNWTSVTITYGTGPTVIAMTSVKDVEIMDSDTLERWQADGHKFATQLVAASGDRGATIIGGDCYKLATIPKGTPCTIVAVLNDSTNKLLDGAMTVTIANAVIQDVPFSGPTNKFAGGRATFLAFSSDGSTDPVSYAQSSAQS